ncbi:vesicle-trafficking protein SEC22a-like [Cimex lectularius]|uniref:Longin domain-containing protein n=1 Tax=Cimex lectularius TaxID=79782 RepID=A0A8I6TIW9_CIMLE|nr:vesicle-trafficking protein SEC22a-like [Cimex lectularius]
MILYVFITRTKDGLPLSASTDFNHEINRNIKENKKYVKMVANKAPQLPERCILELEDSVIYMTTYIGVSYLVLVEYHYSAALAFNFLNDLMKEFIQKYETSKIDNARRPFHFIEFDTFIHKMRQAYNNPQTLARRVNLNDLNAELKLRPPFRLTVDLNVAKLGVGPRTALEPMPIFGWVAILFASLLFMLGILRGFSALHVSSMEVYGGTSPWHGILYITEALCRLYQIYLLYYKTRHRMMKSWVTTSALLLHIFILWNLRNPYQHSVFILSTLATLYYTAVRKNQEKLPNLEV